MPATHGIGTKKLKAQILNGSPETGFRRADQEYGNGVTQWFFFSIEICAFELNSVQTERESHFLHRYVPGCNRLQVQKLTKQRNLICPSKILFRNENRQKKKEIKSSVRNRRSIL